MKGRTWISFQGEWGVGSLQQVESEGLNGSVGSPALEIPVLVDMSHFHDVSLSLRTGHLAISFLCESHYIDCMMEELDVAGTLSGPICARWHLRRRASCIRFMFL